MTGIQILAKWLINDWVTSDAGERYGTNKILFFAPAAAWNDEEIYENILNLWFYNILSMIGPCVWENAGKRDSWTGGTNGNYSDHKECN